jgi:hypothetical protein
VPEESVPSRIAFSTLAFPDATLAAAISEDFTPAARSLKLILNELGISWR